MKRLVSSFFTIFLLNYISGAFSYAKAPEIYDVDQAYEFCKEKGLKPIEGIWIYPEDKVKVLICEETNSTFSQLPIFNIIVLESEDCNLKPGDQIGYLASTAKAGTYKIELFTEKKNSILLKPVSCMASLSNDEETLLIKTDKSKLKFRLNFNFNRLLTGFWKIVSTGVTPDINSQKNELPVGMVKIYPSYDGNGSSKRNPRYL